MARSKIARAERNTRDHKRGKRSQTLAVNIERRVDDGSYPSTSLESALDLQVESLLESMLEAQRKLLAKVFDDESSYANSSWKAKA